MSATATQKRNSEAKLRLPGDWQVPGLFKARLGDGVGRQRVMCAEGHILFVLHEVPLPGVPERKGRLFWRDPDGVWRSNALGAGLQALKQHIGEYAQRVDDLEEQCQAAGNAQDYYHLLKAIAPLHRTTRNLHAILQQAREMTPSDRDLINLRDQAGEIERAVELLHGDAKNGLDFTVAHQSEQQAKQTYDMAVAGYRLNMLAATFLPVATLSAIFGMNMSHGLETSNTPGLFWSILGLGLATGLILAGLIARKPTPIAKPVMKSVREKRR